MLTIRRAAVGLLAALACGAWVHAGQPKLELSTERWDFGTKWYGEDCETEVTLRNSGDAPLLIKRVRSSCGCTVAKPSSAPTWNDFTLEPGASETFSLSYNTKRANTTVSQTIVIESNDPVRPTVELRVSGSIKQLFEMQPNNRIIFTDPEVNSEMTQEITLRSNIEEPMKLELEPADPATRFNARIETVDEGRIYKLVVSTKPPLANGANNVILKVKTNHPNNPEFTVPVSAFVAPRVTVSPRRLFVPRNASNKTERFVRIRYKTSKPLEVTQVSASHASIQAEVVPPRAAPAQAATIATHEIKLTLPPAAELPTDGATVTIKTNDPEFPEFTIQVDLQPVPAAARVNPGSASEMQPVTGDGDSDQD